MQEQLEKYSDITLSQEENEALMAQIRVASEEGAAELIRLCRVV